MAGEKVERNLQIMEDVLKGKRVSEIAKEHAITRPRIDRLFAKHMFMLYIRAKKLGQLPAEMVDEVHKSLKLDSARIHKDFWLERLALLRKEHELLGKFSYFEYIALMEVQGVSPTE